MSTVDLCVVTGASRGLGRAPTVRQMTAGYDAVALARSRGELECLAAECPGHGAAEPLAADLDESSLAAALEAVRALSRAPTSLVNNAATQAFRPAEQFSAGELALILSPDGVADALAGLLGVPREIRMDPMVVHPMVQGTWG